MVKALVVVAVGQYQAMKLVVVEAQEELLPLTQM
jgi:hypothetical protein